MPLTCMNKEVGLWIGGTIGRVDEVDVAGDGIGWGRCLRIWIFLDLTKSLERGRSLNINGKSIWISFKYEKLLQFCYTCERIFHRQNKCMGNGGFRMNGEVPVKPWGVWLLADDFRYQISRFPMSGSKGAAAGREESSTSSTGDGGFSGEDGFQTFRRPDVAPIYTPRNQAPVGTVISAISTQSQNLVGGDILGNTVVDDKENERCLVGESSPLTDTLMDCYIHEDYHATPILKEHISMPAGQCDDHPISVFACKEEVSRHKGDVSSSGKDPLSKCLFPILFSLLWRCQLFMLPCRNHLYLLRLFQLRMFRIRYLLVLLKLGKGRKELLQLS
jgi:hypothetical protein